MFKSIGYAYPTSIIAERLNRTKQGCYFIETLADECDTKPTLYAIPFDCLKSAERAARDMHWAAWSRYSKRLYPSDETWSSKAMGVTQ